MDICKLAHCSLCITLCCCGVLLVERFQHFVAALEPLEEHDCVTDTQITGVAFRVFGTFAGIVLLKPCDLVIKEVHTTCGTVWVETSRYLIVHDLIITTSGFELRVFLIIETLTEIRVQVINNVKAAVCILLNNKLRGREQRHSSRCSQFWRGLGANFCRSFKKARGGDQSGAGVKRWLILTASLAQKNTASRSGNVEEDRPDKRIQCALVPDTRRVIAVGGNLVRSYGVSNLKTWLDNDGLLCKLSCDLSAALCGCCCNANAHRARANTGTTCKTQRGDQRGHRCKCACLCAVYLRIGIGKFICLFDGLALFAVGHICHLGCVTKLL